MAPTPPHSEQYLDRVADGVLLRRLRSAPAVLIEGPRACGKTTTAANSRRARCSSNEAWRRSRWPHWARWLCLTAPRPAWSTSGSLCPTSGTWSGASATAAASGPVHSDRFGRSPSRRQQHSGVGRVGRVQMRPLSLLESGLSTGAVSLRALFEGAECSAPAPPLELGDVVEAVCRGGWPLCHLMDTDDAQDFVSDYLHELAQTEVSAVDGARRDPAGVARLLVSLARNVSTEAAMSTLAADTGGERPIDPRTTASYLSALRRLFVVEDVPAWSPRLRSRSRLRSVPKRQFADPSLAAAALGADRERLLADPETLGFLFESLCVRDLRVYCQAQRAELSHYRDNTGLEVDAIIRQRNGEWIAAEIKLGGRAAVDAAAASLHKLRDRIDSAAVGEPRRLVVITATGFAYERTDGVAVAPITSLGP